MDLRPSLRGLAASGLVATALSACSLALPAPGHAQSPGSTRAAAKGGGESKRGARLSERRAIEIARTDPKVRRQLERYPKAKPRAKFDREDRRRWKVDFVLGEDALVQAVIEDATGKVRESWTGYQVEWTMARGYPGAFGRKISTPAVWLSLCALFFLGLADLRRPLRVVNLDLLVLLSFGVSHLFFNRGEIGVSVPLAYPVLAYLLARMLWVGFRGAGEGLRPTFPVKWLAIVALFLVAFRGGLNVSDSNVIDVGYAGVIGADRLAHDERLYGTFPDNNPSGDTYGPAAYYAYVPFELVWPWHGTWDDLPAAHAAAIAFDLLAMGLLLLLGRRLRRGEAGTALGITLAFAWASYPYTSYVLESNSNDSLVAVLVLATLLVAARPLARGAMLALAAATKFAPLVLVPLFAIQRPPPWRSWRAPGLFALGFVVAAALVMASTVLGPGLERFYDRTVAFQASRGSPFSIWGQQPSLGWLQTALKAATVALGLALAFVPRRRDLARTAALAAAMLIAVQLTVEHWFYLYVVWFFPLVAVALAAGDPVTEPRSSRPGAGPARSTPPGRRDLSPQPLP